MSEPSNIDRPSSRVWCESWDRVLHPDKNCLAPSPVRNTTPSSTTSPPTATTSSSNHNLFDNTSIIVVAASIVALIIFMAILRSAMHCMINSRRIHRQAIHTARASRGDSQHLTPTPNPRPNLEIRISNWWNQPTSRRRLRDLEMGKLRRGLSRVRSIAKPNPEVRVSSTSISDAIPDPPLISPRPARNRPAPAPSPRPGSSPPRYEPPRYSTPDGTPIQAEFVQEYRAAQERTLRVNPGSAGAEVGVEVPPPAYQMRNGDWYVWEDDGTPAPEYDDFCDEVERGEERVRGSSVWRSGEGVNSSD